ncbi:MAG TPA: hypothetical protein VFH47_05775, partial [Candidatus Thermoplasmatota archaeon]|nr:hypothetical protein [Candidatus Thermoplasmatota archaeon]
LLVGITVLTSTALAIMLLSFDGPVDHLDMDVEAFVSPGAGGWGTGDEVVTLRHLGGEPLPKERAVIQLVVDGAVTTVQAAQLDTHSAAFADGRLGFGETWSYRLGIPSAATVVVRVVATGDGSHVVTESKLAATLAAPCAGDLTPPTVAQWTTTPQDVSAGTVGPVTVTVLVLDNCAGVDTASPPRLHSRLDPGTNPPFTDHGPMTQVAVNQWRGTIPDPGWASRAGQVLQYHVAPLRDLAGNTGQSVTVSDPVQVACAVDVTPPTVQAVVQDPGDVSTLTVGSVTVTATLTDDCAGMSADAVPQLWYRIQDGTGPPFVQAGPPTSLGNNQWRATIPSHPWSTLSGRILQYEFRNLVDRNGNTGTGGSTSDTIQTVASVHFPATFTATVGTVSNFANAQSASDGGAEATLAEGATTTSQTTSAFNANTVVSSTNWLNPTLGFASDNLFATTVASGSVLRYGLADPTPGGTIQSVMLKAETSILGYSNDQFTLQGCLGGTCNAALTLPGSPATGPDTITTYDITTLRPGGGAWSWTDLNALEARILTVAQGAADGTWRVDRVWMEVTYTATVHSMNVEFTWSGVPAGGTKTLELRHRVSGDTFVVQVWDGATWNTRAPSLTGASLSIYQYQLTNAELNAGAPRVRFLDANPTGTAQGLLFLEYARITTV